MFLQPIGYSGKDADPLVKRRILFPEGVPIFFQTNNDSFSDRKASRNIPASPFLQARFYLS